MITKAALLERARAQDLLPTTVEKDYVLGWVLAAISAHPRLSAWVFKGGTCLKKCFFETYRFSEDLDFTIPPEADVSQKSISDDLAEVGTWIEDQAGIRVPSERIKVEQNPRGEGSYQAKIAYACRLNASGSNLPRIKFDITKDELLVDPPDLRTISHPYDDAPDPAPHVRCYSVDEILAEKTRALYERQGRARDVYDIVHLSRDFRDSISAPGATAVLRKKFDFKDLPIPTVERIVGRVDADTLRANWEHQLAHQLPHLPPAEGFLSDLRDAIAWWLAPELAEQPLPAVPVKVGEAAVPRQHLPIAARVDRGVPMLPGATVGGLGMLDRVRYAARNRLCAEIHYHGVARVVEPYSLRRPRTGNTLLYAYELLKGGRPSGSMKAFRVPEIQAATVTGEPFRPRFEVEL